MRETSRDVELRSIVRGWRIQEQRVALVPTMGNLHEGHLVLVEEAKQRADRVVVSLFVNPLQFDHPDDLAAYPRTLEADRRALEARGVHLLFLPDVDLMYPRGMEASTRVDVAGLSGILEGAARPGHLIGVATVVFKLLNLVQPDDAVFGEKDFQQLLLVRRMVQELHLPVRIHGVPVVRAEDGLALSSRNSRLSAEARARAPGLNAALRTAAELIAAGGAPLDAIEAAAVERLTQQGFGVDYVTVRSAATLEEPRIDEPELVVLAAAWLDNVRLIDCQRAQRPV